MVRVRVCVCACARACARAQPGDLQPSLIAFAAYIAGQIASVKPREKGHRDFLNQEVQADFEPHDLWNCGIKRALKFMKDRVACPTDDPSTAARLELTCSQRGLTSMEASRRTATEPSGQGRRMSG